jgi:hypothetical protein
LFAALRVGHAANLRNSVFTRLQLPLRDLVHPSEKRIRGGLLSEERGEISGAQ